MVVLTSFTPPTEGIEHEQPSTTYYMNGREIGVGTLYITESKLCWRNNTSGEGFSLLYPHIAIHAVSRDVEKFGHECLYVMVDESLEEPEVNQGAEDEESGTGTTEMQFVPADKSHLDAMYRAMTTCQALHPDQNGSSEDEGYYYDASQAGGDSGYIDGYSNGHNDVEMENTNGQFDDPEED